MNIVLFDTAERDLLYPFTLTKPVAEIRIGIFTIRERWQHYFNQPVSYLTENYLAEKFEYCENGEVLFINASWIASREILLQLEKISTGDSIWFGNNLIAGKINAEKITHYSQLTREIFENAGQVGHNEIFIHYPWDLVAKNAKMITEDFEFIRSKYKSQKISSSNKIINPENIFIDEGAVVEHCILNATDGPIYIGKNCLVMEGVMIRGPFATNENSVLKMGTKIYGATTLGNSCVAGGEIKNSIFFNNSNKAHDGYLGDSVIGEYCNIGAGTSCSNVKNTGGEIKVWMNALNDFKIAGSKCGVFMGDYTRIAINTAINSGTVIGACNNVFGEGLTPKFINSFTWGIKESLPYNFDKAMNDCNNWMQFKNQSLKEADKKILKHIYNNR